MAFVGGSLNLICRRYIAGGIDFAAAPTLFFSTAANLVQLDLPMSFWSCGALFGYSLQPCPAEEIQAPEKLLSPKVKLFTGPDTEQPPLDDDYLLSVTSRLFLPSFIASLRFRPAAPHR